jgi:hypothetical protein
MSRLPPPPDTFQEFAEKFPKLAEAWRLAGEASGGGPLDEKTGRLVKLAVSTGRLEFAVHCPSGGPAIRDRRREAVREMRRVTQGSIV